MSRFADLLIKEDRTKEELLELRKLAFDLEATALDVGRSVGLSGTVNRLRASCVVLDTAGMHVFLRGVETGRIEADGDFLLGSNIAAAATTSLAVFTNAQTYNSESIGAGDLLMGDNTASKANILWDKSAGQLLFRGGTTTQAYVSTSGAIVAGGGEVAINGEGFQLKGGSGTANAINWYPEVVGSGGGYAYVSSVISGSTPNRISQLNIASRGESGGTGSGYVEITGYDQDTQYVATWQVDGGNNRIHGIVVGAGGQSEFQINASEIIVNNAGIDVDTRIETSGNANAVMVDGGLDAVGIMGIGVSGTALTVYGALDVQSNLITNVAGAVNPFDAVNLDTLLDHIGVVLNYWFQASNVMDTGTPGGTDSSTELVDSTPLTLTTIYFKSSVVDTPVPFLLKAGSLIELHIAAEVDATSGHKPCTLIAQLFYVDADGTSNAVQIGNNSDATSTLTVDKTEYDFHMHVSSDTTVPAGKRLWVKFIATTTGGTNDPTVQIYFGTSEEHITFGVAGDVLGRYVPYSLADAENDFLVADGADSFVKKTLAETGAILEADLDHGNIQGLSTGADHSYIDQDVTAASSPTLDGTNITGIPDGALDENYVNHGLMDAENDFVIGGITPNTFVKKTLAEAGAILEADLDHGNIQGLGDDDHTQYILHSIADAANDFLVASGANTYIKKTLAQTGAILEADLDHGNLQGLDTGADHSYINQDVTSASSPTLDGTNFTGIPDGGLDENYVNHSLMDAENDFVVGGASPNTFVKQTLAATGAILEADLDHGNIQGLSTGADHSYIDQDVTVNATPVFNGIGARAYNSGTWTHDASGGWDIITFDSERFDTDTIHNTGSNTSRLTATTAGMYVISGAVRWDGNATGVRMLGIFLNGTTYLGVTRTPADGTANHQTISAIYELSATHYVELVGFQNSGGDLNISANASFSPEFSMVRIG